MSRWDSSNYDRFEEEEESRLLKKFYDYAELEKKESERRRFLEVSDKKKPSVWGNRFVLSAIIQGATIMGLTIALILLQMVFSDVSIIQFLSMSMDGPAKWFFFGYFMYITLVVTIAITAVFYNHLESNMSRTIKGKKNYLVWFQFIGMNLGGAMTTIILIVSGFIGAGFVDVASGSEDSQLQVMEIVKTPILGFTLLFAAGMISGGIAYVTTYLKANLHGRKSELNESRYERL